MQQTLRSRQAAGITFGPRKACNVARRTTIARFLWRNKPETQGRRERSDTDAYQYDDDSKPVLSDSDLPQPLRERRNVDRATGGPLRDAQHLYEGESAAGMQVEGATQAPSRGVAPDGMPLAPPPVGPGTFEVAPDSPAFENALLRALNTVYNSTGESPSNTQAALTITLYTIVSILVVALANGVLKGVDRLPIVPDFLKLVGFVYSGWFGWNYLLFARGRAVLRRDVQSVQRALVERDASPVLQRNTRQQKQFGIDSSYGPGSYNAGAPQSGYNSSEETSFEGHEERMASSNPAAFEDWPTAANKTGLKSSGAAAAGGYGGSAGGGEAPAVTNNDSQTLAQAVGADTSASYKAGGMRGAEAEQPAASLQQAAQSYGGMEMGGETRPTPADKAKSAPADKARSPGQTHAARKHAGEGAGVDDIE